MPKVTVKKRIIVPPTTIHTTNSDSVRLVNIIAANKPLVPWFPGSTLPMREEDLNKPVKPFGGTTGDRQSKSKKLPMATTGHDVNFWDIHRDGVTQSSLQTWLQCPMKSHYKMKLGLSAGEFNHSLDFGSLFHLILDKVYTERKGKNLEPLRSFWKEIVYKELESYYQELTVDPSDIQKAQICYELCKLVLPIYFEWWYKEDSNSHIIEVEKEFSFPYKLRNEVTIPIRGKIDRIDRRKDGIWLFETKTKGTIEAQGRFSSEALIEVERLSLLPQVGSVLQLLFFCL